MLRHEFPQAAVYDFEPYGYDGRQLCSPGFDLPVGLLQRSRFGMFPEYHTSADNLDFISAEALADSFDKCVAALEILEANGVYINTNPKCEPQLGKRGLYQAIGGQNQSQTLEMAILWVLNQSDGSHSLLDIASRSGVHFKTIRLAADMLLEHHLLKEDVQSACAE